MPTDNVWTDQEQQALSVALSSGAVVRSALDKYCENQALLRSKQALNALRSSPKQIERAADAAAEAEVFARFVDTLINTLNKSFAGPTG